MSRYVTGMTGSEAASGVLLRALGDPPADRSRSAAIACFLSGEPGWETALAELGGTFASGGLALELGKE